MPRIIDLTMAIDHHFRWPVERKLLQNFEKGDSFQVTWIGLSVHAFTHVDASLHLVPGDPSIDQVALERVSGEAAVLDLTSIPPQSPVEATLLKQAGPHIRPGDIVLLKTGWEQRVSPHTPEFWTQAPYVTRSAAEWLLTQQIKAVGYDFPQDYPIRNLLHGEKAPLTEFVTHDVLLRQGILQIEYLCNLTALTQPRTFLFALPIKLRGADGAPARVIAWEER